MPKCWSLSTTIRNPERNVPFLKALSRFEGMLFNEETQREFFKMLIKTKAYKPNDISDYYKKKYEDSEEFTDEELQDILSNVYYSNSSLNDDQDAIYALRGRTAVGNLNKMGLVVARSSMGKVAISELGREIMSGEADLSNVFLRYCLKWQLPNKIEKGYNGFNIVPFIAVLHVIYNVNKKWEGIENKPVGVSKEEFALFLTTLIDYTDINSRVNEIIEFRLHCRTLNRDEAYEYVKNRFIETVIDIFEMSPTDEKEITKKVNNLYDYADSAIRYFRQTKLLYYRGNGRYIDLAPTRIVEIKTLIDTYDGSCLDFADVDSYLDYLADINQPRLPWENEKDLKDVYKNLLLRAHELEEIIDKQYKGQALHTFDLKEKRLTSTNEYNKEISLLREVIKILNNDLSILQERSLQNVDLYINKLQELNKRRRSLSGQDPLKLEWYTTLTLMALDDAIEISPNYSIGDDNIPIFTAPANIPDIECYYNGFNLVCEVTLLKGRDQWYNEGQPVMRHLRDFEERLDSGDNYCLFIAPIIHRDTLNTFWMSIKMGYEGKKQRIIPLTIEQYIRVLEIVLDKYKSEEIRVDRTHLKVLLQSLVNESSKYSDSNDWVNSIDRVINDWEYCIC